jgi:hypothetical protein
VGGAGARALVRRADGTVDTLLEGREESAALLAVPGRAEGDNNRLVAVDGRPFGLTSRPTALLLRDISARAAGE